MANQTYIRLLQTIESFASEHLQVKKFASDFPEQLPNFATTSEAYPILFVSPSNSIFNINTNRFDLTIYCYDVIQKDRANINTILSDTNSILNDLVLWLRDGDLGGIDLLNEPTLTPINNELLDYVAGWQMTISLDVTTYTVCEIPFNEQPAVLDVVNDIIYSRYLTCETLEQCDIIQDLLNNTPNLNQITHSEGFNILGNQVTMLSGWTWTIGGNNYTNDGDVIINVPPATDGFSRIDLIVADTNNTFYLVQGEESLGTPVAPNLPPNTLQATFITVDGATIDVTPTPIGTEFVQKVEKAIGDYFYTGDDLTFVIAKNTNYKLSASATSFVDWKFQAPFFGPPLDLQKYDGKEYIIYNNQLTDVVFKHNTIGFNFPFILQNGVDFVLKPTEAIRFIFDELNQTMLQVDNIQLNGDFIPLTGTTNTNPITGNLLFQGSGFVGNNTSNMISGLEHFNSFAQLTSYDNVGDSSATVRVNGIDGTVQIYGFDSNGDATRGLISNQDFTANITDLDFTQKKYVDMAVSASTALGNNVWKQSNLTSNATNNTQAIFRQGNTTLIGSTINFGTGPTASDVTNEILGTTFGHIGGVNTIPFIQLLSNAGNGASGTNNFIGRYVGAAVTAPQMNFTAIKSTAYDAWGDAGRVLFRYQDGYLVPQVKMDIGTDYIKFNSYPSTRNDSGSTVSNLLFTDSTGVLRSRPISQAIVQKKEIRMQNSAWSPTALNNWKTWSRNTSSMLSSDATMNLGTGATLTAASFADANVLMINDVSALSKVSFHYREPAGLNGQTMQLYIHSVNLVSGVGRGSESNLQVLVNESFTLAANPSQQTVKTNFTIANHTFSGDTGIAIAFRVTSGAIFNPIQGVNLILEFNRQ